MGVTVKLGMSYDHTDGSKESRSIGYIKPGATDEVLLEVANLIASVQDSSVKTLTGVKRVETKELQ